MNHTRILFLVRSLGAGGAERQLVLLAKSLHQKRHEVAVAQFYSGGVFEVDLHQAGVAITNLGKKGRWSNFIVFWRLLFLLTRYKPDIVHGYADVQNIYLLLMKPILIIMKIAVVCGVRSSEVDLRMYDRAAKYISSVHRWALRFADVVICNSEAGLKFVTRGRRRTGKYHLVENGTDTERFVFTGAGRKAVRQDWGFRADAPVIGIVGRHDPVKDHLLFLAAAKIISRARPDVGFVIVGSPEGLFTENLKRRAESFELMENLVWAGYQSDMAAVYSAIDLLCMCSKSEGFPNVVAEAMSCGTQCVCVDAGDTRRLVGDAGWVIGGREPSELAETVLTALQQMSAWNREKPRERIKQEFSVDRLVTRTLSVLLPLSRKRAS